MDVLLINPGMLYPKGRFSSYDGQVPPLALLYLSKPLREEGFDVEILDMALNWQIDGRMLTELLEKKQPKVVGITASTPVYKRALKIAVYIKRINGDIKVVMGGPHVTFKGEDALRTGLVDMVVRGEGDRNFLQLVQYYVEGKHLLKDIKGISYLDGGTLVETAMEVIEDVNALSFPARDPVEFHRYSTPGTIMSSRGCPFKCRFCAASAMSGGNYRMRSVPDILAEVDYLVEDLKCTYVTFLDDTITAFPKITRSLCEHFLEKSYKVNWCCESRVDVVDKEMLTLMKNAGCTFIQFGFESGASDILESMGKKISTEQMEISVKLCTELGIKSTGNFLIGFPDDTKETVKQTIGMARKLINFGAQIQLSVLTPFPGTYYYNYREELGITIHTNDWDDYHIGNPIMSTRNFSCDDIREIYFDHFPETKIPGWNLGNRTVMQG